MDPLFLTLVFFHLLTFYLSTTNYLILLKKKKNYHKDIHLRCIWTEGLRRKEREEFTSFFKLRTL